MTNLDDDRQVPGGPGSVESAYVLQSDYSAASPINLHNLIPNLPPVDSPTVIERLVIAQIRRDSVVDATPRSAVKALSECSMLVNAETTLRRDAVSPSIADSRHLPSLSSRVSTIEYTLASDEARPRFVRTGAFDDDGVLLICLPELKCEFSYLRCEKVFNSAEIALWHEHCRSHLKTDEPPKLVSCPMQQCPWTGQQERGEDAWKLRQQHIDEAHLFATVPTCSWASKIDSTLLTHMWNKKIITTIERRILNSDGRRGVLPAVVQHHGPQSAGERARRPRDR